MDFLIGVVVGWAIAHVTPLQWKALRTKFDSLWGRKTP